MKQFEVGKTYYTRSLCDYDCIYRVTILSRTAKTVRIREHNEEKTCRVFTWATYKPDVERIKPHGTYSMCAVIDADSMIEAVQS